MSTVKELFSHSTQMQFGVAVTFKSTSGPDVEVNVEIVQDFEGLSKYLKIYIPDTPRPDVILASLLNNLNVSVWDREASCKINMGFHGLLESTKSSDLKFSGRVLVYTPTVLGPDRWEDLGRQMAQEELNLVVRDSEYSKLRTKYEEPLAFISHDSRDKPEFVSDLANKLANMLCPVWYDEYKLVPGQSLRESIEKGLKNCRKCVVVLSKNYFNNPGWGKREFDSIYTREIVEGKRVMIPIWLGVTKNEVYDYSPILADTFGIDASIGIEEVARRLMIALNYEPPPSLETPKIT